MMEMEPRIKMRYIFAMSSFSRMYGVTYVESHTDVSRFCMTWAGTEEEAPLDRLSSVDFYFKDLWLQWGNGNVN